MMFFLIFKEVMQLHPVRSFFYKDNSQPCFAFERIFPISLIEKQFSLTGKDFSYPNEEYLKYSYIYKTLLIALKECVLFEEARIFFSRILPGLPGVLSAEHLEQFKTSLPKLKEDFSSSEFNVFQEYLDEKLEKSYLFTQNNISHNVWSKWLEKHCNYEFLNDFLSFNQQKFEQAYLLQLGSMPSASTVDWLSEFFKLNPVQHNVLKAFAFEITHQSFANVTLQATNYRYHALNVEVTQQIEYFAQIYNLNSRDVTEFLKNKMMLECGLIKEFLKGDNFFVEVVAEKKPLLSFFDPRFTLLVQATFDSKEALGSVLVNIEKEIEGNLSIADYDYLEPELSNILEALKTTDIAMDILFWGNPGTGKTELSKAITKSCEFNLCNISKYDCEDRDVFYRNQRLTQLTTAKTFSSVLDKYVVLVDEAENILNQKENKHIITEQLENKKVHTIWIVNHIENIDPAYLRRFDYIQEIKGMPFYKRRELSLKLLKNEHTDLAYKIAQAMHTPAEIVAAINWCQKSNKFTWENIQLKMAAYQKAISKVEKNNSSVAIEIIPPEQNKEKGLKNFAGYEYLHESANQIKDLFNNPEKYQKMGSKVPKGILLAGEPGVGKTLFAKCLANEISIPIIKADCALLATYSGAIAELFEQARTHAPCMIFLDEIDVIASSAVDKNGPNTEKQKILNQLLIQMEGFDPLEGVLVLGATHRDYLLDSAVKRSGRFGETIHIRSPSHSDRQKIWEFYTYQGRSNDRISSDINFDTLAKLSATMSAADINQCVNMAATSAASLNKENISQIDLEQACNKLFWGTDAQGMPITKKEQWRTAIHEAGHALIALKNKQGIRRATVRPHLDFLGAVDLDKPEGVYSTTLSQIKQSTEIFFGGMLAEKIVFDSHANGVTSDLSKASSYVMEALLSYGMGQTLGSVVMTQNTPTMSEARIIAIEAEHRCILDTAYSNVEAWLRDNRNLLVDLACLLIEKRSIGQTELYEWFHHKGHQDKLDIIEDNDIGFDQLVAQAYQ